MEHYCGKNGKSIVEKNPYNVHLRNPKFIHLLNSEGYSAWVTDVNWSVFYALTIFFSSCAGRIRRKALQAAECNISFQHQFQRIEFRMKPYTVRRRDKTIYFSFLLLFLNFQTSVNFCTAHLPMMCPPPPSSSISSFGCSYATCDGFTKFTTIQ